MLEKHKQLTEIKNVGEFISKIKEIKEDSNEYLVLKLFMEMIVSLCEYLKNPIKNIWYLATLKAINRKENKDNSLSIDTVYEILYGSKNNPFSNNMSFYKKMQYSNIFIQIFYFFYSLKNKIDVVFYDVVKSFDKNFSDYEINNLYKYLTKENNSKKNLKSIEEFIYNIFKKTCKEAETTGNIIEKTNRLIDMINDVNIEYSFDIIKGGIFEIVKVLYQYLLDINTCNFDILKKSINKDISSVKTIKITNKINEELKKFIDYTIKEYDTLKDEYKFELFFRAPSNIERLNNYIQDVDAQKITPLEPLAEYAYGTDFYDFINKFQDYAINKKIDVDCEKKDFIKILYDFWYNNEKASIFKIEKLTNNERLIYKDFIASKPNEFNDMTTFDTLTKMRHYEVPNRLLDVTTDPLLALFFACGQKDRGSKTVFLYLVKEKNIKYYDSDTITVLSVLSKLRKKDKKNLKYIIDIFSKNKKSEIYKNFNSHIIKHKEDFNVSNLEEMLNKGEFSIEDMLKLGDLFENYLIDSKNKYLDMKIISPKQKNFLIEKFVNNYRYGYEEYLKKVTFELDEIFNIFVSTFVPELNWQLKNEIPSWHSDVLNLDTFTQCYLVKPKMNNPRIIAQSGAFFIYPFENIDINTALFDGYIFKIDDTKKIKEDLEVLNIKPTKFTPDDLTVYAKEIKEKYS